MMDLFIPIRTNFYHNKNGDPVVYKKAFHSLEECQEYFDKDHYCYGRFCEYCAAKWEDNKKCVDYDGAYVEHVCHKVKTKNQPR